MVKLFHKDVFIPDGVVPICTVLQKRLKKYFFSRHFSEHLENQLVEDKSHTYLKDVVVKCLESLQNTPREVFEVELTYSAGAWDVTKYCCRIPYDGNQDLVVAIRPQYANGNLINNMIVTAWMNSHRDNHYTLDRSKYISKQDWNNITESH